MSSFTADSFGIKSSDRIGCVGTDANEMKGCIMAASLSESLWNKLRQNELEFIEKTHNRNDLIKVWDQAIKTNFKKIKDVRSSNDEQKKMNHGLVTTKIAEAFGPCPEGERFYGLRYPDVEDAVKRGIFESHFAHYIEHGKNEGKRYHCDEDDISYVEI